LPAQDTHSGGASLPLTRICRLQVFMPVQMRAVDIAPGQMLSASQADYVRYRQLCVESCEREGRTDGATVCTPEFRECRHRLAAFSRHKRMQRSPTYPRPSFPPSPKQEEKLLLKWRRGGGRRRCHHWKCSIFDLTAVDSCTAVSSHWLGYVDECTNHGKCNLAKVVRAPLLPPAHARLTSETWPLAAIAAYQHPDNYRADCLGCYRVS